MSFIKGIGKAGKGIIGGAVHGSGKVVETVGEAAGSTPVVGGVVGDVVGGTGKVVETVGDAISCKKEEKGKDEEMEEAVEGEEYYNPFFDDIRVYVSLDGEDDRDYYDDTLEDLLAYDAKQAKLREQAA